MGILEDLMSGAKTVVDFAEEKTAEAVERIRKLLR